ncbi:coiled-coil domain-containing protein 30 isoform X3 [Coturnix japonica]|uniref:coiled-coil domain-containing protein 30 isoform X3 n=1 Tax=Coturnix japonica TaxID=93934 RepID=UPI000776C232|nr:coiled-coil domain-containing protein 30 isoform X3 [Coturnix japonica]
MEEAQAAPVEPPVPAEDVRRWLQAEGKDPSDPAEEQLGLAWRLLRRAEERLGDVERRRAEELRDVERYVGHVRGLSQERDEVMDECERENERLGMELERLRLQHEAQLKEVQEMLEQEGLSEIAHSNASEQIAYLLVERTALLEKLQVTDQKLNTHSCADRLCAAQLQPYREELERERASRVRVERDLAEATQSLLVAHEEIQRLKDELAAQGKEQSKVGAAPWSVLQEPESQGEGMDEWRQSDRTELQKAMEHNSRLDKEILALRARVQALDLERKTFLDLVEQLKEEISEYQKGEKRGFPLPTPAKTEEAAACSQQGTKDERRAEGDCIIGKASSDQEDRCQGSETLHKRCREVIENIEGRNSQLLHKLHKLEQEHEDLVECNEELESILGDTQIQTKQDKEQFESEVEGLHWKITSLETELLEVQKNKTEMSGEEQASDGAQEMQEMLQSCQETIEKLGSQLGERREWRKQLASELELLREDLKAEKKGLPNTKPELKSQSVQRTSTSRDFINASHEKLQKDNALLDTEVSELVRENEQVNKLKQQWEDASMDGKAYEEQMAKVVFLEEQIRSLTDEQEQLCSELLESNKKREELEKQLKESNEEKQSLLEEIAQLKQDILTTKEQRDSTFEEALRMNQGTVHRDNRFLMSQSSAGSLDGSIKQNLSEDRFQQQEERLQQLRHDLRRVQNVCSSAERELRYEREKNIDLQKQNLLLQQECTKVKAELKQARTKLLDTTETCSSLSAQWEKSQQKVKELEQELLKCSQADKLQSSLQEKLVHEKSKVYEAQRQISKIQQKLKDSQHQLLLAEARVSDKKLLEEELKEAREKEARVQQELREELLKRKLLEQQVEELRQQLRHSQETEASLAKMHVELQAKTLNALEEDKKTDSGEHLQCQKESQKLSEQVSLLKEENKALYAEGVRLLNQKDLYVRKYNDMQLRHKEKIRKAKATFIQEVKQRDSRIKQLENELSESKLQVEKGKALIAQITTENEKLLQERRRLLQRIIDQEETTWNNRSTVAALQSRVKILDEENMRLHESKLHLSGHVHTSQRALRSIHAPNTEDLKNANFSERQLQSKVSAPPPRASFLPREPPDSLSSLKPVLDSKPEGGAESQDSSFCFSPSQPSEIGYLNVASPGDTATSQLQEESQSISSENM